MMSLLDEVMQDCVLMNKTSMPDGFGESLDSWNESDFTFKAAILSDVSVQQDIENMYIVTTSKRMRLNYNDVFKRLWDGKLFRVTGDVCSAFDLSQYTAEEYVMPNG